MRRAARTVFGALAGVLVAAMLAGCADKVLPVDEAGRTTALPSGPAAAKAQTPQPPDATASLPSNAAPDQCGARDLAYLVGKARTEIPVPVDPSRRRVICTTCPTTQDFRADRQTITYDAATNLVVGVTCG